MPTYSYQLKPDPANGIRFATGSFTRRITTSLSSLLSIMEGTETESLRGLQNELIDACGDLERSKKLRIRIAKPTTHSIPSPILASFGEDCDVGLLVDIVMFDLSNHSVDPHQLVRRIDDLGNGGKQGRAKGVVVLCSSMDENRDALHLLASHLGNRCPLFSWTPENCHLVTANSPPEQISGDAIQSILAISYIHRLFSSILEVIFKGSEEEVCNLRKIFKAQLLNS